MRSIVNALLNPETSFSIDGVDWGLEFLKVSKIEKIKIFLSFGLNLRKIDFSMEINYNEKCL